MPNFYTREERRERLAAGDAEGTVEMIAEVKQYLSVAQLSQQQFAQMVGKGHSTIDKFLHGKYDAVAGSDLRLRKHLRAFLDANPIVPAETASGKLYDTENVQTLRLWFDRCLNAGKRRGRMACVYAGPGSQKTFVTEHLVAELNREQMSQGQARTRAFHIYTSQGESPLSLVHKLLYVTGLPIVATIQRSLASLRFLLRRNRTLFIFDEAQHLSVPCLEIIRELNDLPPHFGVMLLGSHRLRQFFTENAAQMEQWHSRITEAIELPGIAKHTIAGIVRQELDGIANFDTKQGAAALEALLQDCLVRDIYSGKQNQHYYSVRKVFMTIESIREEVEEARAAEKGVAA